MCFFVDGNNNKVQIADKNIVCWKTGRFVGNVFVSIFQKFSYTKGKLYKVKGRCLTKIEYKDVDELYNGFHSYVNDCNPGRIRFIIPKGARYLKDCYDSESEYNEYISNQIIMV